MGLAVDLLGKIRKEFSCSCFSPPHVLTSCSHATTQITHTNPATVWNHSFSLVPPRLQRSQCCTRVKTVCHLFSPSSHCLSSLWTLLAASPHRLTWCSHTAQTYITGDNTSHLEEWGRGSTFSVKGSSHLCHYSIQLKLAQLSVYISE